MIQKTHRMALKSTSRYCVTAISMGHSTLMDMVSPFIRRQRPFACGLFSNPSGNKMNRYYNQPGGLQLKNCGSKFQLRMKRYQNNVLVYRPLHDMTKFKFDIEPPIYLTGHWPLVLPLRMYGWKYDRHSGRNFTD